MSGPNSLLVANSIIMMDIESNHHNNNNTRIHESIDTPPYLSEESNDVATSQLAGQKRGHSDEQIEQLLDDQPVDQPLNKRTKYTIEQTEREQTDDLEVDEFASTRVEEQDKYRLDPSFLEPYKTKKPPFGYNGFGELVYRRTYSRRKRDQTNESWWETVERVVNGTFTMQKRHARKESLPWNTSRKTEQAQDMYDRIFHMKFLPPGRGLFIMGSPITEERGLFAALNNCAFVTTQYIGHSQLDSINPFIWLMDASMLGIGVGFDTKGANQLVIRGVDHDQSTRVFQVPDTRSGWVEALGLLLSSHFHHKNPWTFDYSLIRAEGTPLNGFGGLASGPACLQELLSEVDKTLSVRRGQPISITDIADIMNRIGKCVVAGSIRRSALISFGDADSDEYINLKNYQVNPQRASFGWSSNNSVFAQLGMDYQNICKRIQDNGEPGLAYLENMQNYSRMDGQPDYKDHRVQGGNPCLTGDTMIATDQGLKRIDQLIGKPFHALVHGQVYPSTEQGFWSSGIKPVYQIQLSNGQSIKATGNHKFKIGSQDQDADWTEVLNLQSGQLLVSGDDESKSTTIQSIQQLDEPEQVYDCTINQVHCFSANGILSHNCLEQSLEPFELCCLVETFPNHHDSLDDFKATCQSAFLYAKTVTLGATMWQETNAVMKRNRRIGTSVTGIAQFLGKHKLHELKHWLTESYTVIQQCDKQYSEEFAIPLSIKTTSVKPSGTISLVAGATPGIHYPESRYYIRRMRIASTSELLQPLRDANYPVVWSKAEQTWVVEVPIDVGEGTRTQRQVGMWEQLSLAAFMQKYWSDNQVSATVTFDPETEGQQIEHALDYFQYQLKGISFLPRIKYGAYELMPYEEIDEHEFQRRNQAIQPLNFEHSKTLESETVAERFCDNDKCNFFVQPVVKQIDQ